MKKIATVCGFAFLHAVMMEFDTKDDMIGIGDKWMAIL